MTDPFVNIAFFLYLGSFFLYFSTVVDKTLTHFLPQRQSASNSLLAGSTDVLISCCTSYVVM